MGDMVMPLSNAFFNMVDWGVCVMESKETKTFSTIWYIPQEMKVGISLFIQVHSISQIFIAYLPCTRHCHRSWEYSSTKLVLGSVRWSGKHTVGVLVHDVKNVHFLCCSWEAQDVTSQTSRDNQSPSCSKVHPRAAKTCASPCQESQAELHNVEKEALSYGEAHVIQSCLWNSPIALLIWTFCVFVL